MSKRFVAPLVAMAALILPTAAHGASISALDGDPSWHAIFMAEHGEANDLHVRHGFVPIVSDRGAPLVPGAWCAFIETGEVECRAQGLEAFLRDGDDQADVVMGGNRAQVWGGSGNDRLKTNSYGGATEAYGEGGNDYLWVGGESAQIADGGRGDDVVHCCGWQGNPGTARGGSGDDEIHFNVGLASIADLEGGPGDDVINALAAGVPSTADGGSGNDIIRAYGSRNGPYYADGSYTITGRSGEDTLVGGEYDDTLDGGDGRDYIDARGGGSDTITCGAGEDTVHYDDADTVSTDCEVRFAAPAV
jgi:hypothetical protein